jgi:hypothetical protein
MSEIILNIAGLVKALHWQCNVMKNATSALTLTVVKELPGFE